MRILFLLSCLEPAGSETYCVALAEAWQGKHEVHWISDLLFRGQTYTSMPIHMKAFPMGVINVMRVAFYIRRHKIEVIHSHSRRAHWVAAQAAALCRIPHVTTIHQPPPVHFFSRRFPCFGDATIAIDEAVAEHLQHHFPGAAKQLVLIRNGINLSQFVPSMRYPPKLRQVLVIGRLSGGRWPVLQFFLDVLQRTSATLPPAHYKIVGRIPEERRGALINQLSIISSRIAPAKIETLGYVGDLNVLTRNCDAVIAAGRSAIESMANGRPTILMGEGGVLGLCRPEIWTQALRTNMGDHIVPKDFQPAALEAALRELLQRPADQGELIRWLRSQIEKQFDIRMIASQIERLYERLCHSTAS